MTIVGVEARGRSLVVVVVGMKGSGLEVSVRPPGTAELIGLAEAEGVAQSHIAKPQLAALAQLDSGVTVVC